MKKTMQIKLRNHAISDQIKQDITDNKYRSNVGLKTPAEWEQEIKIQVLDPDGWRFKHAGMEPKPYGEPISKEEFLARTTWSTCQGFNTKLCSA